MDKSKQIHALMPNLIHSLDASSLAMLYDKLSKISTNPLFFSINDCFAVPATNIETIKMLLQVYVYIVHFIEEKKWVYAYMYNVKVCYLY